MFNEKQLKALSSPLPRSAVKSRRQGGGQVAYIEGQYVIDVLNSLFGFGMWDHEVREVAVVCETQGQTRGGKEAWEVAYRATVRLTIRGEGGQVCIHEDVGGDNSKLPSRGEAHENALKGAVTDALKRCARCMGEQFGLSLYGDLSQVELKPTKEERIKAAIDWALDEGAYATREEAEAAWQVVREDTLTGLKKSNTAPTWDAIERAWAREVRALKAANADVKEDAA